MQDKASSISYTSWQLLNLMQNMQNGLSETSKVRRGEISFKYHVDKKLKEKMFK